MATATNEELTHKLNELVQYNIDSANGFKQAAESVDVPTYKDLFRRYADQRERFAGQLKSEVSFQGGDPSDTGHIKAVLHRWWLSAKGMGDDPEGIFEEARRGEDAIKDAYAEVIEDTAGHPVQALLQSQHREILESYKQMDELAEAHD
jgi:uncharacterized protein (TIGR02284 family)